MILYALPVSTFSAKVRIALQFKGIDYQMQAPPDGYGSTAYRAIVPMGTIPAIEHESLIVSESDTILEYLDEQFPDPPLLPQAPADRARHRFLGRFHDLYLDPPLRATFRHVAPQQRDEGIVNEQLDRFSARLQQLESLIDPQPFLLGSKFGMADCAFPATLVLASLLLPHFGRAFECGPRLDSWLKQVLQHPAVSPVTEESHAATLVWMQRRI